MAKKLQKEAEELSEHFLGCGVTHKFTGARYANGRVEVTFDDLNTIQVGPLSVILCTMASCRRASVHSPLQYIHSECTDSVMVCIMRSSCRSLRNSTGSVCPQTRLSPDCYQDPSVSSSTTI